MKIIYDRAGQAHVLTLDLDHRLRDLLVRRFASFVTPWGDLSDWTDLLLVEPGDEAEDIQRELGFTPLVDPDGAQFGEAAFHPFWDHLVDRDGWFELTITFGSAFAYILFIADEEGMPHDLLALCRRYSR